MTCLRVTGAILNTFYFSTRLLYTLVSKTSHKNNDRITRKMWIDFHYSFTSADTMTTGMFCFPMPMQQRPCAATLPYKLWSPRWKSGLFIDETCMMVRCLYDVAITVCKRMESLDAFIFIHSDTGQRRDSRQASHFDVGYTAFPERVWDCPARGRTHLYSV